jgi:hypothetical protein
VQGEHLSGPFAGTVTGPNGFVCSIDQSTETVPCLPLSVPIGTTVTLTVALTKGAPGDLPVSPGKTAGCDAITTETCTITMDVDRNVRLGIGCAICSGP